MRRGHSLEELGEHLGGAARPRPRVRVVVERRRHHVVHAALLLRELTTLVVVVVRQVEPERRKQTKVIRFMNSQIGVSLVLVKIDSGRQCALGSACAGWREY